MKIRNYIVGLLFGVIVCSGCDHEDIMLYQQRPGVYFEASTYSYTFLEHPDSTSKILRLSVDITGSQVDYDRTFTVTRPAGDTITTAEDDQYRINEGIVKANEYNGYVEIEVFRDERLNDSIYEVALVIQPGEDFPEISLNQKMMVVSFTNKVIQPANWRWLRWHFGEAFSTRWWTFICEVTGRTSLPYYDGHPDTETWWMSYEEIVAYAAKVRIALAEYNAKHPEEPLTHDDGEYAGQVITMP
jgi:hypothetical protein